MEQRKLKWREEADVTAPIDQLLASRYSQLLQWGTILTRGDAGKTEEIVQELCLYFTLTQPDLASVVNLVGYLYTSLRHIYLSGLARASREALRFVSIAEFDSFDSALAGARAGDPLQEQNDLRRICAYAVWRKESSKSASYFILHFFHGYGRREIAELACLPISAIYNKLKIARSEVTSYLEAPGKLRVVSRDIPPPPRLSWSVLPAPEFFAELRETILRTRHSRCLASEQLLARYDMAVPQPVPCSLLAHIVSCEPCLAIVDRHFRRPTLQDREPLDGFGASSGDGNSRGDGPGDGDEKVRKAMQVVRRRRDRVREHRPRTLSIAVNGQILAFHDVRAEHSKLSARIAAAEKVEVVEVFSEQDVRLALLSMGELPPAGEHTRTQRVELSDDRWLELSLTFDGLGLNGQVAYFDPALASRDLEEDPEESPFLEVHPDRQTVGGRLRFRRWLTAITPSSAFAWMLLLALFFATAGYFTYRHAARPTEARKILDTSVKAETETLQGQTEHQLLRIEEVSSNRKVLEQGTVDLWKDGNGERYLRRLYDAQHRMLAAEWRNKTGEHNSRRGGNHPLSMNEFWDQDLSAHAFSNLAGPALRVRPVNDGYELTTGAPIEGHPKLVSAALVINRQFQPVRATLWVRSGSGVHELRFVQAGYERKPSHSVPDAIFDPASSSAVRDLHSWRSHEPRLPVTAESVPLLAELQIAVLYQLHLLNADTGEPIEVKRTDEGRIEVSGAIADPTLKRKIAARLQGLVNHQFLDLKLFSSHELRMRASRSPQNPASRIYEIDQTKSGADAILRHYFQAKGLSGAQLDAAVVAFSHDALEHAQRALQDAYALDRLGGALSATELRSVSLSSQQQWTEMLRQHASELQEQLLAIRRQLGQLSTSSADMPEAGRNSVPIENPLQFSQAAGHLLQRVQELNRHVSSVFASGTPGEVQADRDDFVSALIKVMPLQQAGAIQSFAIELNSSEKSDGSR